MGESVRKKQLSDDDVVTWVVEEALVKRVQPKNEGIASFLFPFFK
jgi:hypothetical protein